MTRNRPKTQQSTRLRKQQTIRPDKSPFSTHLFELRRRFMYIALSVILWAGVAYAIERQLISALLRPAHGQSFIYTSPIGGMNFIFRVCLYAGIALSIPVVVYHFLRYIEPLMKETSARFVRLGSLASGILAAGGMAFGYFIGLPAALHFLLHQFVTTQIRPLLTIDAYLSFVTVYMLGAALMFQIPLIILFINRIKPLNPKKLLKHERWAILFAVILGGIMNPTPNLFDQLFVVGPILLTYQLSIVIIWLQNRTSKGSKRVQAMLASDLKLQAERQERLGSLRTAWNQASEIAGNSGFITTSPPQLVRPSVPQSQTHGTLSRRPRKYVDGFVANGRLQT